MFPHLALDKLWGSSTMLGTLSSSNSALSEHSGEAFEDFAIIVEDRYHIVNIMAANSCATIVLYQTRACLPLSYVQVGCLMNSPLFLDCESVEWCAELFLKSNNLCYVVNCGDMLITAANATDAGLNTTMMSMHNPPNPIMIAGISGSLKSV